jgi:hypothetical protein
MKMVERIARAIAEENGDDFDSIPANKAEWVDNRGEFGGRQRDVNEPFQRCYTYMALAALKAMNSPLSPPASYAYAHEEGDYFAVIEAAIKEAETE